MKKATWGLLSVALVLVLIFVGCASAATPTPTTAKPTAAAPAVEATKPAAEAPKPTPAPTKPAAEITKPAAATPAAAAPAAAPASAASAAPAALTKLVDAAKAEGQLDLVGGIWFGETIKVLEDAFNSKYGIKVSVRYAPGDNMPVQANKLIEEAKAGQKASTDLFIGTEAHMPRLNDAKILKSVNWKEAFPYIPDDQIELNGTSLAVDTLFHGVTYNTKLIPQNEVPKTTQDLLNPKWKGKIASTPYASGFDRIADPRVLGYDKTKAWIQSLAKSVSGLINCDEVERIASGEFLMLAMDCGSGPADMVRERAGAPVASTILEDAVVTSFQYVGVPAHSAHPNLATLFAGFLASKEGQLALRKSSYTAYYKTEGAPENKTYADLTAKGFKVVTFTTDYTAPRSQEMGKWRSEFQGILAGK